MTSRERALVILSALTDINAHMGYQFTQPLMNARDAVAAAIDEAVEEAFEEAATKYRLTAEQTRFANQPDIIDRCKVVALAMSEEAAIGRARRKL